jgi:D-alanyl-D-alanine-carboxypeptidase/D-alanyl-D-alanine-endopeptidase
MIPWQSICPSRSRCRPMQRQGNHLAPTGHAYLRASRLRFPNNLNPKRADNPWADYTVEKLYAFVSGYKLTCDPGTKYEYSTVGMALLSQAIALKAGTNYESLMVDRICRPLKMDSTRITLTPELKSRFAQGHNQLWIRGIPSIDWGALKPGGAVLDSQ